MIIIIIIIITYKYCPGPIMVANLAEHQPKGFVGLNLDFAWSQARNVSSTSVSYREDASFTLRVG